MKSILISAFICVHLRFNQHGNSLRNDDNSVVRVAAMMLLATCLAAGCTINPPDRSYLPAKIPAIKSAVSRGDLSVAPQLVKDLESSDPAVRFYAIEGLARLTGETFGYVYYDDRPRRDDAVIKWKRWLSDQMDKRTAR